MNGLKKNKKYKRLYYVILLFCFHLTGCKVLPRELEYEAAFTIEDEAVMYETTKVKSGTIQRTEEIIASSVALGKANVSFPISGVLVKDFFVKKGDRVNKGELLGELDNSNLYTELNRLLEKEKELALTIRHLKEEMDIALLKYQLYLEGLDPIQRAFEKTYEKVSSEWLIDIGSIEQEYKELQENIANIRNMIENGRIYAPIAGIVIFTKDVYENSNVIAEDTMITIIDDSVALFQATSTYKDYFIEKSKILIHLKDEILEAEVVEGSSYGFEPKDNQVYFKIVTGNRLFGSNEKGNITVLIDQKENILYLPKEVVKKINGKDVIHYIHPELGVQYREIKIGFTGDNYIELLDGVNEGEEVVIY